MKIKDFLSSVAKNRNAVYEKICSIGATSPEYFELRDDEVIKTCGYDQNATIDSFYSSLTDSDFETIRLIMEPYVSEKKNNASIVRRK